jgi:hypothetical protein
MRETKESYEKTLRKHFRVELSSGKFKVDMTAGKTVVELMKSRDERVRLDAAKYYTARSLPATLELQCFRSKLTGDATTIMLRIAAPVVAISGVAWLALVLINMTSDYHCARDVRFENDPTRAVAAH